MPDRDQPDAPRVARIVRYPVKGLPGVETAEASIAPGRGLLGDRVLAVERGALPVEQPQGWNPRETYFHMAKTEQIARLGTALTGADDEGRAVVTVTAPDGSEIRIRLDAEGFEDDRAAADAFFAAELPAGPLGPPRVARTGVQLWDWPGSQISIINLASLRALEQAAGAELDIRRFRANLYLDGLQPWAEFGLLGRRIRIGDAEFEVFQPTDRCRATTIDPATAVSDLNVPALLAGQFGHMFCGVYARPVRAGIIRADDGIEVLAAGPIDGAEHEWPRSGTVLDRVDESTSVTSIWFRDAGGFGQRARPGQHIRVHLPGEDSPAWRCYTISGVRDDAFRISVKRDGRISSALHDTYRPGDELVLTGPFGEVVIDADDPRDVLLLSAGAGITPTVAMLRALAATASRRRIRVLHVDRDAAGLPLWDEVLASVGSIPDAAARLFLTRAAADDDIATAGRPTAADYAALLADLDPANLAVYACGPASFTAQVRETLAPLGVAEDDLQVEVFFSPTTAELTEPREPSTTGPHLITIGENALTWTPASGSILDTAEGVGIPLPSGCRVGACGTCVRTLVSGEVEYLQDPLAPPKAGRVLVCCSVPVGDVVLG